MDELRIKGYEDISDKHSKLNVIEVEVVFLDDCIKDQPLYRHALQFSSRKGDNSASDRWCIQCQSGSTL